MTQATGNMIRKPVEKTITVDEVVLDSVTLELSPEEAQVLADLIGFGVVGNARTSRRKHTDAIWRALAKVEGIETEYAPVGSSRRDWVGGTLQFQAVPA